MSSKEEHTQNLIYRRVCELVMLIIGTGIQGRVLMLQTAFELASLAVGMRFWSALLRLSGRRKIVKMHCRAALSITQGCQKIRLKKYKLTKRTVVYRLERAVALPQKYI